MPIKEVKVKRLKCYLCKKPFKPYQLEIGNNPKTPPLLKFRVSPISLEGLEIRLCSTCKMEKLRELGEVLQSEKFKIHIPMIVKVETP